jgi:CheY-like chemotaxis protein
MDVDRLLWPAGSTLIGNHHDPADILLVEDNPADVRLTLEALQEEGVTGRLHVARDGEEALAFLRREDPHHDAPRPSMVLLDLNLPRMNGRDVLEELKRDADLGTIPVVVLTTSTARSDIPGVRAARQLVRGQPARPGRVSGGDPLHQGLLAGHVPAAVGGSPGRSARPRAARGSLLAQRV